MQVKLLHTIENKGKTYLLGSIVEFDEKLTTELLEREIAVSVESNEDSQDGGHLLHQVGDTDDGFNLEDQLAKTEAGDNEPQPTVSVKTGGSKKGK